MVSPSQQAIAAAGLLTSGFSCVLHLPTGSGKTHLAWQAIQREVDGGGRAILCVPLRALANQLFQRLTSERPDLLIGVYTGESPPVSIPKTVTLADAQVLIMTPERLDACTRAWGRHWTWLPLISLLVVDEVHLLGEGRRGARLEGTLLRLERLNPCCRVVALSATLGNAQQLADWLGGVLYQSDWRPVPLAWQEVTYTNPEAKARVLCERLTGASGNTLVFVQSRRRAEQLAAQLRGAGLQADHHHAGLRPEERTTVETAFVQGRLPVLVCTSTLELGLNLPCRRVVLYDLNEWNGQAFAPLLVRKAWQRAGRAGRYGLDARGEVITLRAAWDRAAQTYVSGQVEAISSQLTEQRYLLEQVVADIACGLLRTRAGINRFYARTLASLQGTLPAPATLLDEAIQAGLITEDGVDGRLRVTPAGRVAGQHLLAPETVLRWAALEAFRTPFDLLWFFITLPDVQLRLPVDYERLPELKGELERVPSLLLREDPGAVAHLLHVDGRALLHTLHTAAALWTHLGGLSEDSAAERFSAYPFEFRRLREEVRRVVLAALQGLTARSPSDGAQLAPLLEDAVIKRRLHLLAAMLGGPLSPEAATLTRVSGIGPRWAHLLQEAGLTDLEDLALADPAELSRRPQLSPARAAQWVAQAGELVKDWTEVWADPPAQVTLTALPAGVEPYRLLRAAELQVQVIDRGYRVTGGQEPHLITRRGSGLHCDCPDHASGQTCKHLLAVGLRQDAQLRATLTTLQESSPSAWSLEHLWMQA